MEIRESPKEKLIPELESTQKKEKKTCCCFPFFSRSRGESDGLSTISIALGDEHPILYNIQSKPRWQKDMIEEFALLKEDLDQEWINLTLKHLLNEEGPEIINKPEKNFDREKRTFTNINPHDLGRKMSRIVLNEVEDENIVNKQLSTKVEDGELRVALTLRNYSNTLRVPSKSTVGRSWNQNQGRLTKKTYFGGFLGDEEKKAKNDFINDSKEKHKEKADPGYHTDFFDNEEILEKKVFNFLNKDKISMMKPEEKEGLDKLNKDIAELYSRILAEFSKKNDFFDKLIKNFIQAVFDAYVQDSLDSSKKNIILDELVEKVKFFSCLLSISLFTMFKSKGLINDNKIYEPEQIFTPVIFYFIFSTKKVYNKDKSKLNLKALGNVFTLSSVLKYHIFCEEFKDKINKFQSGKKEINRNIEKSLSMLPSLLRLDESSLDLMNAIIEGNMKKPETLIQVKLRAKATDLPKSKPYAQTLRGLRKMSTAESPYEKLYYLVNSVNLITQGVDHFYQQNGISASFAITAEELFPIIIYLLSISGLDALIPDLLFINLFMTNEMSMAEPGFCLNTFLAAHEYISGFSSEVEEFETIIEGE